MKINVYWLVGAFMGGLFICSTYFFITDAPRLVVIDMKRAIHEPAEKLAHSKLSSLEQEKLIARYTKCLPDVIHVYAASHHVTVLSAAVLESNNQLDITNLMIQQTIQRLKHER